MTIIFKPLKGYEKHYEIGTDGTIRIIGKIRKTCPNKDGYRQIGLSNGSGKQKMFLVHRLVAETFIDNSDNLPTVNHRNGIKNDNNVDNLEWCTITENLIHAYRDLLYVKKLTKKEVKEIFKLRGKLSQAEIAKIYKVSQTCISHIHRQTSWKWLTGAMK